jgi:hypothetical protein
VDNHFTQIRVGREVRTLEGMSWGAVALLVGYHAIRRTLLGGRILQSTISVPRCSAGQPTSRIPRSRGDGKTTAARRLRDACRLIRRVRACR